MSRCLASRTSILALYHPVVLPFLAPAVYRRYSDHDWRANAERFKYENRQTRRQLKPVRDGLWKDSSNGFRMVEEKRRVVDEREPEMHRRIVHFGEEEVRAAGTRMRAEQKTREMDEVALKALAVPQVVGRRFSRPHYGIAPEAVRAVERAVRQLEDEVYMAQVDRKYRQQRRIIRWLLDNGRTVEAIRKRAKKDVQQHANAFFGTNMAYLILYKGTLRLAGRVMEALADVSGSLILANVYHMWVSEWLWKFQKDRGVSENDRRLGEVAEDCVRMLVKLRNHRSVSAGGLELHQMLVHQLATSLPLRSLADAFWTIEEQFREDRSITPNTAMHFLRRLLKPDLMTRESLWREAVKILMYMHYEKGHCLNTRQGKNAIYGVLSQALCSRDQDATDKIMGLLSDLGVEPGPQLYNLLMTRAMKEGDGNGLRAYLKVMIDNGHVPDFVSFTILHTYNKKMRNDAEREKAERSAKELGKGLDKFLATDILHHMVLQRQPYDEVFRMYRLYFSTSILERFGLVPDTNTTSFSYVREPDHATLAVMFMSYCNNTKDVSKIWPLYLTYRRFLYTQRKWEYAPIHDRLLQNGSYFPHIIMMGLGRCYNGLPYVAQVIDHLFQQSSKVRPDVITWSIYLKFLTRAGKMEEAENVLTIMRSRGYVPNVVSWTTLLDAYVKDNLVTEAEDMLDRMKTVDGVSPNVVTWTGMLRGYIKTNQDWKAGSAFRMMMDQGIEPEEKTLEVVTGVQDRMKFEAGLAGESETSDDVFEDGLVRWPGVGMTLEEQYEAKMAEAKMAAEAERTVIKAEVKGDGVFEEGEVRWPSVPDGEDSQVKNKRSFGNNLTKGRK